MLEMFNVKCLYSFCNVHYLILKHMPVSSSMWQYGHTCSRPFNFYCSGSSWTRERCEDRSRLQLILPLSSCLSPTGERHFLSVALKMYTCVRTKCERKSWHSQKWHSAIRLINVWASKLPPLYPSIPCNTVRISWTPGPIFCNNECLENFSK